MMKTNYNVFVVDDEPMVLKAIQYRLKKRTDLRAAFFTSGEACIENMTEQPDIVILDHNMDTFNKGQLNGFQTLKRIKKLFPKTQVAMLSSQDNVEVAVEALKKGASDYVVKDSFFPNKAENLIDKLIQDIELNHEINDLTKTIHQDKKILTCMITGVVSLLVGILIYNWMF